MLTQYHQSNASLSVCQDMLLLTLHTHHHIFQILRTPKYGFFFMLLKKKSVEIDFTDNLYNFKKKINYSVSSRIFNNI